MNEFVELHAIVHGRVQEVGFRAKVYRYATQLNITGIVFNTSNGDVEICAQGSRERLSQFLHLLQQDPGRASIERVVTSYGPITRSYDSFVIIDTP